VELGLRASVTGFDLTGRSKAAAEEVGEVEEVGVVEVVEAVTLLKASTSPSVSRCAVSFTSPVKSGCKVLGAGTEAGLAGSMLSISKTVAGREGSLGNGIRTHLQ